MTTQAPITPDHVYRMKDGSMRLVVSKTAGDLTYLTETDGRFVPGTEQTTTLAAFGGAAELDLGTVDPGKLF